VFRERESSNSSAERRSSLTRKRWSQNLASGPNRFPTISLWSVIAPTDSPECRAGVRKQPLRFYLYTRTSKTYPSIGANGVLPSAALPRWQPYSSRAGSRRFCSGRWRPYEQTFRFSRRSKTFAGVAHRPSPRGKGGASAIQFIRTFYDRRRSRKNRSNQRWPSVEKLSPLNLGSPRPQSVCGPSRDQCLW